MADIATLWSVDHGDYRMAGADLAGGADLATAVLISLFTDSRASADDVIPDSAPGVAADPRGWWGDLGADRPVGSKLWLYVQRKALPDTLTAVNNAIQAALQWLIDDGVAAGVDVVTQYIARGQLGAWVTVRRQNGATQTITVAWPWSQLS